MHFEILVEDQSGQKMLDILVPKIIGANHTCKVIAYKGVGRIPKNINAGVDASKRMRKERPGCLAISRQSRRPIPKQKIGF